MVSNLSVKRLTNFPQQFPRKLVLVLKASAIVINATDDVNLKTEAKGKSFFPYSESLRGNQFDTKEQNFCFKNTSGINAINLRGSSNTHRSYT